MRGTLGIVLAGGAGLRLGLEVPKAEAVVHGMTLRDRALETLAAVCDAVVLVSPRARVAAAAIGDVRWIEDEGEGPLSGIVAGLGVDTFDRALVLGVDFPLVRPPLLHALLDTLERSRAAAVMCAPRGIPQPLVAAYAPSAAEALQRAFAAGERSITRAMVVMGAAVVTDDFIITHGGGLDELMNVNTPEDIAAAGRALAGRARYDGAHDLAPEDRA
jgi:molybdopterin-guanine dinucleotide biosynthesis protein A